VLGRRPTKKLSGRAAQRQQALDAAAAAEAAKQAAAEPQGPLDPVYVGDSLGEAFKAAREAKKLTLQQVADLTRVRRVYLEALEAMNLEALPNRPFTIGYIRAYASALGLEPDLAVERFKTDQPVLEEELRAPVGVLDERDPRVAAFLIGALVIVVAIVLWNVAQRAMSANAPPPPLAAATTVDKALRSVKPGTVELGAPLPAPVESTTPPPYETPGLAEAMGLKTDPGADKPKPANQAPTVDLAHLPTTFQPQGKVYDTGNPQLGSVVTLQALKPAALILRGADGSVYFARQLSKGDAFKVPNLAGITLDVSNGADLQVFVYGQSKGVLPANQVLASKLVTAPAAPAASPKAPAATTPTAPPKAAPKAP
jgi:cytoskeleton protein RodZ